MSGVDLLGAFIVSDSVIGGGALLGAGLTGGALAGLGAGAIAGAEGAGLTNLGSLQAYDANAAATNSPQTLANQQLSQQQMQQSIIKQMEANGMTPEQAQAAVQNMDPSLYGQVSSALTPPATALPAQVTSAAALTPGGGIPSGVLAGLGGAGAGLVGGSLLGGTAGSTPASTANNSPAAGTGLGAAAPTAAGTATGTTAGTLLKDVTTLAPVAAAAGTIVGGTTGGGVKTTAPNPGSIAGGILQDEINYAPSIYQTTQQYAPQYAGLQSGLLNQSASGVLSGYQTQAPALQGLQTNLNAQQAGGNLGLVGQYGSSFNQAFQAANPQLQQTQNTLNTLANTAQNPVGAISGAGSQLGGVGQQAIGAVGANAVQQAYNPTLSQLNATAQQQLALGTGMSQQEASTVANQVLSNYNSMGRANDPTAIAGLATGLDTYGQQLLQQREAAASSAAGQLTTAQTANQQAQATNLSAQLGAQGLNYEALSGQGAQQLQGAQANQQAQLSNASYQQDLLQNAASLEQSTGNTAMNSLLGQSQGLSNAYNTTAQGGTSLSNANALSGMYNPFNSAAYGPAYSAATAANQTNATTNAGLIGGGLSLLGNLAGNSGFTSSLAGLFG